jgi:hypothetical protein
MITNLRYEGLSFRVEGPDRQAAGGERRVETINGSLAGEARHCESAEAYRALLAKKSEIRSPDQTAKGRWQPAEVHLPSERFLGRPLLPALEHRLKLYE